MPTWRATQSVDCAWGGEHSSIRLVIRNVMVSDDLKSTRAHVHTDVVHGKEGAIIPPLSAIAVAVSCAEVRGCRRLPAEVGTRSRASVHENSKLLSVFNAEVVSLGLFPPRGSSFGRRLMTVDVPQ